MAAEETAPNITFFEVMRVRMQDAYSLDDLKTLCHDLTVNYDDLSGETLSAKAREIVTYFKRNGRLLDLVDYCRRTRADVDWPKPPPSIQVASAFTVLKEMLEGDVKLRDAVNDFKHNFEAAHKHIGVVNFFKSLHDRLHRLQVLCYDPLMDEIRGTADVREALESISKYVEYFKKIVEELRKIVSPIKQTYDTSWINELAQAQMQMALSATPDDFDADQIKKAAASTNNILSVEPGKINGRLMGAVDTLDLPVLQEAMENVSQQFTRFNLDQEKVKEFTDGIDSLQTLTSRFLELTREHDRWQDADRVLRRVDEQTGGDEISELEVVWPRLQPQIARIFETSAEEWAVRLKVQSEKLDEALKANPRDFKSVTDLFDKYRQLAVQRFFKVDEQVLNLCSGLVEMDKRLSLLLEKM
jgi:effector-associated domain 7 (EAD7)-containing protein